MSQRFFREFVIDRTRLFADPRVAAALAVDIVARGDILDAELSESRTPVELSCLFSINTDLEAELTAPMNLSVDMQCGATFEAALFSSSVENRPPIVQPVDQEIVFVEGVPGFYQIVATDPDLDPVVYDKNDVPLPPGVTLHPTLGRYVYDGTMWGLTEDVVTIGHLVYVDDQRSDPVLPPKRVFAPFRFDDSRRIYQHVVTTPLSAFFHCTAAADAAISTDTPMTVEMQCGSAVDADLFALGALLVDAESFVDLEADLSTEVLLQGSALGSASLVAVLLATPEVLVGKGQARASVRQGGARAAVRVGSVRARTR